MGIISTETTISRRNQNVNISAGRTGAPDAEEETTGTYRKGMERRLRNAANRKTYKKEGETGKKITQGAIQKSSGSMPSNTKTSASPKTNSSNFWSGGPEVKLKNTKNTVRKLSKKGDTSERKLQNQDTEWDGNRVNQDSEDYTGRERGRIFKNRKGGISKPTSIMGTIFFHFLMLAKAVVSAISNIVVIAAIATLIIVVGTIGIIQSATYNFLVEEKADIASYINRINDDFSENTEKQKNENECTEIKKVGKFSDWREVIAFWWILEVDRNANISEKGYEDLKKIFYEFNRIGYEVKEQADKKILYVTIKKYALSEMYKDYGFSDAQIAYVDELLNDDELWKEIFSEASLTSAAGNLIWPVTDYYYITSKFGPRDLLGMSFHHGMDIGCPIGTPVHACADGVVVDKNMSSSIGLYVQIDHGSYKSIYMHNSSLEVQIGQEVKAGDVIAYSGNTGQSTGPHCHIGISVSGEYTDPAPYFGLPDGFTGNATEYMK